MKKVVIIHGWRSFPENCWYPQTKTELEKNGFEVVVPNMPDTAHPKLSLWLTKLQQLANNPSEDLLLVGHSAGCITILRYLEQLKENEKIGGVILVAGFTQSLGPGYEELESFFEKPVDFNKVKNKSNFFTAIHSDNDTHVSLKYGDIFKEKLNAKLIVMHNMDHFSNNPRKTASLPIATDEILRMSN